MTEFYTLRQLAERWGIKVESIRNNRTLRPHLVRREVNGTLTLMLPADKLQEVEEKRAKVAGRGNDGKPQPVIAVRGDQIKHFETISKCAKELGLVAGTIRCNLSLKDLHVSPDGWEIRRINK